MKKLEGSAKHGGIFLVLILAAITLYFISSGAATTFSSAENNQPTYITSTIRTLNISVSNTDAAHNITKVVVSLHSSFTFIEGSNTASALNTNFTNETNDISPYSGKIQNLTWRNTSVGGFINASGTEYFIFKTYLPSTASIYNLTVYTYNITSSTINSTNITLTISGLSSTKSNFSFHKTGVAFNWTNSTITVEANVNLTRLYVDNLYTNISSVYFTQSEYPADSYLGTTNREKCFDVTDNFGLEFAAENTSAGEAGFLNRTGLMNETNTRAFKLSLDNVFCPPGLYKGTFALRNLSDPTKDRIHVPATIHVPISASNTFTEDNNTAYFKGSNTSQTTQSFYFLTNITQNVTAATINITGPSVNFDLFLVNISGKLLEKSISTGSSSEEVFRFLPSTTDRWEIRLVNIINSFTGYLYFTTLNITNTTLANTSIRNLTFGSSPLDPNETNTTEFRLVNEDTIPVSNVKQKMKIYNFQEFQNSNTSKRFELFVPNYTTKLKVRLEWNNDSGVVTDWDLFLRDNTGRDVANSTNKTEIANSTELVREEFIIHTGTFNTSYEGIWNITVLNQGATIVNKTLNFYNVTTYIYFNETLWINTSFNTSTDFNLTGTSNSSYNITAKAMVPRNEILNGTYSGLITYYNNSGWKLKLPFFFQLKAGHLFVNKNLSTTTVEEKENTGNNRTVFMNITFNNTGGFDIYFANSTSNYALFLTTNTSKNINFTIDGIPSNPISAGTGGLMNITITADTRKVMNTPGIYRGWILFNTTNITLTSSSYPYDTFNLTIDLNLTDRLNATITKLMTGYSNLMRIENTSTPNNLTLIIDVRMLNGTILSKDGVMNLGNFYSVRILERNTSKSYTLTNIVQAYSGENFCDYPSSDVCNLNATAQLGLVGGQYTTLIEARWNTSQINLTGTAFNTTLIVNNTGLNMTAPGSTALGTFDELGSVYLNVTVGNLGPLAGISTEITLNKGTCPVTVTRDDTSTGFSSGCTVSDGTTGATHTITIDPYTATTSGCALRWKITGDNVTTNTACTGGTALTVTGNRASFTNITGVTLTVRDTASSPDSGSGSSGGGGSSSTTTCSTDSDCSSTQYCSGTTCTALSCESHEYIDDHACVAYAPNMISYESAISITYGETNSTEISVNEANNKTITLALNASISDDIETNVTPESCTSPCSFTVNFSTTSSTEIKVYEGTFKAFYSVLPDAYQTKSFSLTVLPTEAQKAEINQKYLDYLPKIDSLIQEFEALKTLGTASEGNLTMVESLISSMNSISADIKAALDAGNYVTANMLMTDLNSTITQIKTKFSELKEAGVMPFFDFSGVTWWIVIGIIVVGVVAFIVYLLLPPKTSRSRFAPKGKGVGEKFRSSFKRMPKIPKKKKPMSYKITKYSKGYVKHKPFVYKKKENPLKRLFRKKKQKGLKDFSG